MQTSSPRDPQGTPLFTLEEVTVAFAAPDGGVRVALEQITLSVRRGEWLAVVGKNGSGKSTLARVLAGLCPLSRGRLHTPYARDGRPEFGRIVLQNPESQIIGATPWEDVCFGLEYNGLPPDEVRRRAQDALAAVGLAELAHVPVDHLSGGQKQRLCVAACAALQPQALILDEATAMLHPAGRQAVLRTVQDLYKAGTTIIWVTHGLEELAAADRVVALDDGRLVFEGTPAQFFYGEAQEEGEDTPCRRLGFPPPFAVQVALRLRANGIPVKGFPLLPEDLAQAVDWR